MHFFRKSHLQSNKNKRFPLRRKRTTKQVETVNEETTAANDKSSSSSDDKGTAANDNSSVIDSLKDRLRPSRVAIVNVSCGSEIESDNDTSSLFSVGSNLRSDSDKESGSDSDSVHSSSVEEKTRKSKRRNYKQSKVDFTKWRTGSLLAKEERKQIRNLAPALLSCR